jgi:hypothetical protein
MDIEIYDRSNKTTITTRIDPKKMPEHLGTDDPLVLKTSWKSMNTRYGQRAQTHNLVQVNDNRIEFRLRLLLFLPFLIAIVLTFATPFMLFFGGSLDSSDVPILLSWLGTGILIFMLIKNISRLGTRIVIDKDIPALWKGKAEASQIIDPQSIDGYHSLKKVHAVQIIKHLIVNGERHSSYYKHEIYLVFDNAERVFLVGYGKNRIITEQAEFLSEFLNIPLWDGRSNEIA